MVGLLGERMKLRACFARFYRPHPGSPGAKPPPGGPSCIKASEQQPSLSVGSWKSKRAVDSYIVGIV